MNAALAELWFFGALVMGALFGWIEDRRGETPGNDALLVALFWPIVAAIVVGVLGSALVARLSRRRAA